MARSSPPTSRVVDVLDLLAVSPGALNASEISRSLDISSSTCAVLLRTLDGAGYVERSADRTYRLGPGLLPLARAVLDRYPLLGAGHEELRRLSHDLACGVTLTRIDADHLRVVTALGTDGHEPLGVAPGDRFPLTPPYGAIAMAWRPPDEVDAWLDGWPPPAAPLPPADRGHERRVMDDIAACGIGVWSLEANAQPVVRRIREIIAELAGDPSSRRLRDQLAGLFGLFGLRGYTSSELAAGRTVAVGYALAAVFGPDGQPRYEIDLHLLRPELTAAAVAGIRTRLAAAAQTLTAAAGGTPPEAVARAWAAMPVDGRSEPKPARRRKETP